jgi:hypothetical protein
MYVDLSLKFTVSFPLSFFSCAYIYIYIYIYICVCMEMGDSRELPCCIWLGRVLFL